MENHQHVGMCMDKETAERDGPLLARTIFCGCERCVNFDFSNCLMKSEFGTMKRVFCKVRAHASRTRHTRKRMHIHHHVLRAQLARNQHVAETRSIALEEFALLLDKDQTHAVHASRTEWHIEGPYWLAKLLGKAYQTQEDQVRPSPEIHQGPWHMLSCLWQVIAGQQVPKGYWLVKARFYKLVQTSQRAYVLLKEEIELNVNALVRLPEPVTFDEVKARKKPVQPAQPARQQPTRAAAAPPAPPPAPPPGPKKEKPNFLGEPKHNEILASLAQVRL